MTAIGTLMTPSRRSLTSPWVIAAAVAVAQARRYASVNCRTDIARRSFSITSARIAA